MILNLKNTPRNKIIIMLLFLIILFLMILIINKKREEKWNNQDISNAVHGIIIEENTSFYRKPKETKWKLIKQTQLGENAYILEEVEDKKGEKWLKVKIDKRVGYVKKDTVKYFEFDNGNERTLMSDVSKFNIQFKHFENANDYEFFLIKSNINYVYIRLGGRGYGEDGNFYVDPNFDIFIEACEYLGVPYGFYYIDEAINSQEVQEEIHFIKKLIDENKTKMCVLPLVIDIETYDGVGRADDLEEDRAIIANELVQNFKKENIETIIYANAKYANDYLYTVDSKFWLAYYDKQKCIPLKWYTETDQDPALNQDLMHKLVAWQFTEDGAGNQIPYSVDVSLVDNTFFKNFVKNTED